MQQSLPENLKPLEREIDTYFHALPSMIEAGQEGQYALIRDDRLIHVYPSLEEADAAGHELFGLSRFMAQKIHSKDLNSLAPYFSASDSRVVA